MSRRSFTLGAVTLACACSTALATPTTVSSAVSSAIPSVIPSGQTLGGLPGLACQAVLCLSSSLQPSECAPSLSHYFGIQIFNKFGLDWGATVAARRMFLGMCPAADAQGMPARIDAIANGAGKCDPASLNIAFADTAYRYRSRTTGFGDSGETTTYDVQPISTVRQNTLPGYCVTYNDHEWTYDLSVKYVGDPLKGGYWVKAKDFDTAQSRWQAEHSGQWARGWSYSWDDPRYPQDTHNGN